MLKNDLQEGVLCTCESTCPTLMERCGACLFYRCEDYLRIAISACQDEALSSMMCQMRLLYRCSTTCQSMMVQRAARWSGRRF